MALGHFLANRRVACVCLPAVSAMDSLAQYARPGVSIWVERLPFFEPRNRVMRMMENLWRALRQKREFDRGRPKRGQTK